MLGNMKKIFLIQYNKCFMNKTFRNYMQLILYY